LIAPRAKVHVDDVVVGNRQTAELVRDGKCPLLVTRLVVPDDPQAVLDPRDPERARRAVAPELGVATGAVARRALRDRDVVDRLALAERNVPVSAGERAGEVKGDLLADEQRRIRLDPNVDSRSGERVRLGVRAEGSDERRDRQREEDPEPAAQLENCTAGASRATPSASKYARSRKLKIPATTFVGTVSSALS
jgi:hypothetical protein